MHLKITKINSYKKINSTNNNIETKRVSKKFNSFLQGEKIMANKSLVPEAKEALNRFKMESAAEVGVNLKQGYNGDLTSKQAGSIGGQMVKKMVESYENSIKTR